MALTNDQITAQNFKDFYGQIRPYLNGAAHSGFTPVGTVISVMGKTAPMNYLVCDGTVYNIADYSELANYFAEQFDAANFFGGDGVTTFAVPDLRGEFLRGTGTNSHENQGSGANVGVHQDATINRMATSSNIASINDSPANVDWSAYNISRTIGNKTNTDAYGLSYTARPTNTSVLYCIAVKNIFMDAGMNFSTEEQVVGTWIDGKPLYQITFAQKMPTISNDGVGAEKTVDISSMNIDYSQVVCTSIKSSTGKYGASTGAWGVVSQSTGGKYYARVMTTSTTLYIQGNRSALSNVDMYITIQYTKTTD